MCSQPQTHSLSQPIATYSFVQTPTTHNSHAVSQNPTIATINFDFFSVLQKKIKVYCCYSGILRDGVTIVCRGSLYKRVGSYWLRERMCLRFRSYTVSALSEAYQILSESSRLSFQIFSQSPATKLKVLYNQNSSELYQLPSELANKNHQRRFQI